MLGPIIGQSGKGTVNESQSGKGQPMRANLARDSQWEGFPVTYENSTKMLNEQPWNGGNIKNVMEKKGRGQQAWFFKQITN